MKTDGNRDPRAWDRATLEEKALARAIVEALRSDLAAALLRAAKKGKARRAGGL